MLGGGLITWLIGPADTVIVGAGGLVFGWMGYLLARAVFSRRLKWILVAVAVLFFYGTLLAGLLPSLHSNVSWQANLGGFVAGAVAGAVLHPRGRDSRLAARDRRIVTRVPGIDAPIGMMDSGVGGLTVARAVLDQLPHESLRYVGDTANSPYGPKPIAEVRAHALDVMDELVASGVKALVIACNSASAACLRDARERYDVPVSRSSCPRSAAPSRRRATTGSASSAPSPPSPAAPTRTRSPPRPASSVTAAACPRFAEFVERGVTSGRQLLGLAESYLVAAQRRRRRHAGAGLHALPAADRAAVGGDGRLGDARVQRGGDGEGRLPHAARPRSAARATTTTPPRHEFRATGTRGALRAAEPAVPRPADRRRTMAAAAGSAPVKLTVIGCSGSVPGPDSPASSYLVEADGYRLLLDLGHGAFGALQRYVRPATSTRSSSRTCTPTTASTSPPTSWRCATAAPGFRCPDRRIPVIGVPGTRDRIETAYDPMARKTGPQELFSFATADRRRAGAVAAVVCADESSDADQRGADRARRHVAGVLGGHRRIDRARRAAKGADVLLCEASVGPDEAADPGPAPDRPAGRRARRSGPVSAG